MPRPSSPLDAKASVRSPYALDRSQQNSCVGTEIAQSQVRNQPQTPTHALCLCQTMMSSQESPSKQPKPPGNPSLHFVIDPVPPADRPVDGNSVIRDRAGNLGGARRDRTDDLMLAKHALYQLSYGPSFPRSRVPLSGSKPVDPTSVRPRFLLCLKLRRMRPSKRLRREERWWAQADSNCRPHAYQACALTT